MLLFQFIISLYHDIAETCAADAAAVVSWDDEQVIFGDLSAFLQICACGKIRYAAVLACDGYRGTCAKDHLRALFALQDAAIFDLNHYEVVRNGRCLLFCLAGLARCLSLLTALSALA